MVMEPKSIYLRIENRTRTTLYVADSDRAVKRLALALEA